MFKNISITALCLATLAFVMGADDAEFQVKISGMHLCCGACTSAVKKAVAKVEDVKETVDQGKGETLLVGKNQAAVQKALDAIEQAGFVGKLDNEKVSFKKIKAPEGKVSRLELTDVHNCCGGCTKAIKGVLAKVDGVKSDTATAKKTTFVVEGDFVAKDLVAAMAKAGFYCNVKE